MAREQIRHYPRNGIIPLTGIYQNDKERRYEYWFVFGEKRSMVGWCWINTSRELRDFWAQDTKRQLDELMAEFTIKYVPNIITRLNAKQVKQN